MGGETRKPRFYVPSLRAGELTLPPGESHHARSVLRLGPGQAVELFDGLGHLADGEIIATGRGGTVVRAGRVATCPPPAPAVHLAFAVPKGKRLDWLLEKATELGAASLWPVVFRRSVAAGGRAQRWAGHCIAAAKQCGLNQLPEIRPSARLVDFLATIAAGEFPPGGGRFIFGDLSGQARLLGDILADGPGQVVLLIGPEGGFTDDERGAIVAAGFEPVRLGGTTLRIETAAVALIGGIRAVC